MASFDTNWAQNPYNRATSLARSALPEVLFKECKQNCFQGNDAQNDAESLCLSNCQSKAYHAFDLYMSVRMRMDANKKYEHVVDVSKFTEMETEAGHDTANQIS